MLCVFHDRFYGRRGGDRSVAQSSSPCRLVKILAGTPAHEAHAAPAQNSCAGVPALIVFEAIAPCLEMWSTRRKHRPFKGFFAVIHLKHLIHTGQFK